MTAPVIQLDILPTALAAAGVPSTPPGSSTASTSSPSSPAAPPPASPHESLYWRFGAQDAIRRGDWKLVRYDAAARHRRRARRAPTSPSPPAASTTSPHDPGESRDLAADHPAKVQELLAAWHAWDRQLVPPRWGPEGNN